MVDNDKPIKCEFTINELLQIHNLVLSICLDNVKLSKEYRKLNNKVLGYLQEEL